MNINESAIASSTTLCVSVCSLPYDMRRVLRMQFKEFINLVEDEQLAATGSISGRESNRVQAQSQPRFNSATSSASTAAA